MVNCTNESLVKATVCAIAWERVTVFLDVKVEFSPQADRSKPLTFYAVNGAYLAKAQFTQEILSGEIYRLSVNVSNPGNARCIPTGNYSIVACQGENILAVCETDPGIVAELPNCSRSFLHGGAARYNIYAVDFLIKESDETLPFLMHILYAQKAEMGDIYDDTPQPASAKSLKRRIIDSHKRKIYQTVYNHHRKKYRNNENTVMFLYEENYNIDSNLRAVRDRLKARGLDDTLTVMEQEWQFTPSSRYGLRKRLSLNFDLLKKLAMPNIILMDNYVPEFEWLRMDKETKIICLWHAGAGFKSVGYSRWGHLAAPAPFMGHRVYTYGIAGSKHIAHFFSEAWGINTERVIPTGMPRIDKYLDAAHREATTKELYEKYPFLQGKKVILFAPTFRGSNHKTAHYPFDVIDFDEFNRVCGDEYIVLFKMHPWISQPIEIPEKYADKFYDFGSYSNINELFYVTDLLITDYSSSIYEFSLMRKPMLFFAYDEVQYAATRGFHREYKLSAPGKVCATFEELLAAIEHKDFEYEKVEEYVEKHFDIIDSNSSDRVIDWLLLGQLPQEYTDAINARDEQMKEMFALDFSSMKPVPVNAD